jgi:sugar phosphate isomerase/epimerase
MIRISNYSLNYSRQIAQGKLTVFDFLKICRGLDLDGASLHVANLPDLSTTYLKQIRRAYLDLGLSLAVFTVTTDFGRGEAKREFEKALEAIRAGMFLGAPLLRLFAGSPPSEGERPKAFERAAQGLRRVCEEAAQQGLPVGLQNHNHDALCRTADEVLQMIKLVDHPNLVFLLDTGQWAGSRGASGQLRAADFLQHIRRTASLARYVRVKFYNPGPDGAEPWIPYDQVFDILRSVHYGGFIDIVYEPGKGKGDPGEDIHTALPRVVRFLRGFTSPSSPRPQPGSSR